MGFVSVGGLLPYFSIDSATGWKKTVFILSKRSDFLMIDNLSIVFRSSTKSMLTLLSTDEILLPRYSYLSSNFRDVPLRVGSSFETCFIFVQMKTCLRLFALGYAVEIQSHTHTHTHTYIYIYIYIYIVCITWFHLRSGLCGWDSALACTFPIV